MCFTPLEQFEIISLKAFPVFFFDFTFSNLSFFCFFIFFILCFLFVSLNKISFYVPSTIQSIFEVLYSFILRMVVDSVGYKFQLFFPFFYSLFLFLLLSNLLGLIPFSFTITSQFIFTFSMSFIVWFGKGFIGFKIHGLSFFKSLLPSGVPFGLVPFFVFVECLSYFIPLIALGVRLFANMMSGHILLKVFVGFCWILMFSNSLLFFVHFILFFILFILFFLEAAVAFIQAYVFCILSCLSFGDSVKGGH